MSDFSLGMPIPDTSETSYLMTPHIVRSTTQETTFFYT